MPPASCTRRDALNDAWDQHDEDERRDLCDQFDVDPVGTVGIFESPNFDYDVIKSWLEGKC